MVHDAEQWIERGGAEMLGCGEGERKVMTGGPGSALRERAGLRLLGHCGRW